MSVTVLERVVTCHQVLIKIKSSVFKGKLSIFIVTTTSDKPLYLLFFHRHPEILPALGLEPLSPGMGTWNTASRPAWSAQTLYYHWVLGAFLSLKIKLLFVSGLANAVFWAFVWRCNLFSVFHSTEFAEKNQGWKITQ